MESGCQDFTHIGCCSLLLGSGTALGPFIHVSLAVSTSSIWISPPAPYNAQVFIMIKIYYDTALPPPYFCSIACSVQKGVGGILEVQAAATLG